MTHPSVPHESISRDDADTFCRVIEGVLRELSFQELKKVRLVGRSGIAISFDGEWQPFLGHTLGYNNSSKPPRLAIPSCNRVLEIASAWLKRLDRPQSGGRVFLNDDRVVCDKHTLGTWQWDAENPVIRFLRFRDSVEATRIDEAWRAAGDACIQARLQETRGDAAAAEFCWSLARRQLREVSREADFDLICGIVDRAIQSGKDLKSQSS